MQVDPISNATKIVVIFGLLGVAWLARRVSFAWLVPSSSLKDLVASLPEKNLSVQEEEAVGPVLLKITPISIDAVDAPAPMAAVPQRAGATRAPTWQEEVPYRLEPRQGTWDLRSLPHGSNESLKRTFETLPFDTALSLLRTLEEPSRRNVLRRLPVMPAIKKRLEKALDS